MNSRTAAAVLGGLTLISVSSAQGSRIGSGTRFVEPLGFQRAREIAFRGFEMIDAEGKPIGPQTKMELSNGRVVTAQEFYDSLNRIERGLNKVGHSLRESTSTIVLSGNYADEVTLQKQVGEYTRSATLSMSTRTPTRRALVHSQLRPTVGSPRQRPTAGKSAMGGVSEISKILGQGTTLGNDATTSYTWSFDKPFGDNAIGVRLKAGLTLSAQSVNSANPPSLKGSTTTIAATFNGGCQGTLLGTKFDILNGICEVGTSSATGKVSVGWSLNVAGYQVLSENKSYDASYTWNDAYSIPFQKQSQTMEFPIFGPFACSGFVGVEGEAGIKANLSLNPIYADAEVIPYVKAGVYGEVDGGLEGEVASAWGGLHADLTLVDDQFTLGTNIGIVALPGNKVGWRDKLYIRNRLNLFTGTLSMVAHVFGPGGVRIQDFSYPFYSVRGYSDSRTLYETGSTNALDWAGN